MRSTLAFLLLSAASLFGCSTSNMRGTNDGGIGEGADLNGVIEDGGGKPFDRDAACAQVSAMATLGKKPVDIIFVIDNSGSMTEEITGVERNIDVSFAKIIGASGIDYRVIMVSKFGSASNDQSICIGPPLGGNNQCPNGPPVNTANYFVYDTEIDSHNSLSKILSTYNMPDPNGKAPGGWSDWLRPDALKVFVEITDDEADMNAQAFEAALFALKPAQFGDANARNYVFHSIVGLKEKANKTAAYLPNEPVQNDQCCRTMIIIVCTDGAEGPGDDYQNISKMSGGLRFPVCQYDNYDAVFKGIAGGVVAGAKVACDFALPAPPMGQTIDLDTVVVEYTPGNGGPNEDLTQVKDASECAPGKFYIDEAKGRVYLCPAACTTIQADMKAQLRVLFDCGIPLQ